LDVLLVMVVSSLEQTTFNKTMRVSLKGTVSSEQSAAKQTRADHFEHMPDGCLRLGQPSYI
jgi:hypothetical protein